MTLIAVELDQKLQSVDKDTAQRLERLVRDAMDLAQAAPVGSFAANQFGLFDLGGNAAERCEGSLRASPESENNIVRGASFILDSPDSLLSSSRSTSTIEQGAHFIGFRVVLAPATSAAPEK